METARAEDPTRSALAEIVAAWRTVIGMNNPMPAAALKRSAIGYIPNCSHNVQSS